MGVVGVEERTAARKTMVQKGQLVINVAACEVLFQCRHAVWQLARDQQLQPNSALWSRETGAARIHVNAIVPTNKPTRRQRLPRSHAENRMAIAKHVN